MCSKPLLFLAFTMFFAPAAALAEEPLIRLGATVPLTGSASSYGKLIRDGVELAKEDLTRMGYRVETYYEDVPRPGTIAATAIEKLVTANQIHALAGNFWNPAIPIMAQAIERSRIPAFHTAAADDLILGAGEWIVSTNAKVRDEAEKIADYAYDSLQARTASVLYVATTFGEHYSRHFVARFNSRGGRILDNESTEIDETNLRPVITRVRSHEPDVIFAAYFGESLGVVLRQARQNGIKQKMLSVYEAEDPSVLDTAGEYAEGLEFYVPEPARDDEARTAFKQRFLARYGYAPRILASNAYDGTMIVARFLSACNMAPVCARNAIASLREYPGASGTFSIDADGGALRELVLKRVVNGKFITVPAE